ncbi:hypothetical protein [Blastopirellula marina]|uniref:hypothetical protein n=1 Tax=Blastopirellula marina TaxID=124 RepID=UPI0011B0F03C|nr:hypothetical protein [Blastopirellula marina]
MLSYDAARRLSGTGESDPFSSEQEFLSMRNMSTIAALLVVAVMTLAMPGTAAEPQSADHFFELREAVNKRLKETISKPLEGTTYALPASKEQFDLALHLFPDREFIEHVTKSEEYRGGTSATLVLNLDKELLAKHEQGSSKTMTATVLLNHYLQGLEKLGFRSPGSPGATMSAVQMASNVRFIEGDPSIVVEATVFVAPQERQAIVTLHARERLQPSQPTK